MYRATPDEAALAAAAGGEPEEAARHARGGPPGSRDVELLTRRLQLLHGGRHPDLQGANTLSALAQLQAHGLVAATVAESLAEAYSFLRTLEHRLQIAGEDEAAALQPGSAATEIAARRMGFSAAADLESAIAAHRNVVTEHCAGGLGRSPNTV